MSNSYKIDLGVSLNQGDLGKIKTQLNNFQNQKKINLEINRKKIDSQLNSIRKQIQNLSNIKIDLGGSGSNNNPLGGLTKTLSDLSNVLNQFVANTGNVKATLGSGMSSAVSSVSAVTKNIKNADIVITDTFNDVQSLKKALGQLGFEKSAIDVITKDFQELGVSVKNVTTSLRKDGNVTLTIKGIDQYERAVTIMKSVGKDGSIKSLGTSISQSFKETEVAFSRLKSLANEIGSLKIKIAGLDVDKNKSEISELTSYLNKLEAEYNELYAITSKNLNQGQLDTLTQSAQRASEKISQLNAKLTDTSSAKKQVQAFKELMTVLNQLNSKKIDLTKIGGTTSSNSNQVRTLLLEIHQLEQSYNNLLNTFNKQGIKFSADQWNQIKTAMINTGKEMDVIRAKIADVRAEMAKGIQVDLLSGNYDTELINLENRLNKITNKTPQLETTLKKVKLALQNLKSADGTDALIASNETYLASLEQLESQLKQIEAIEKRQNSSIALQQGKEQALLKLHGLYENGSAAARKFGGEVEKLDARIRSCGTKSGLKQINKDISILQTKIKQSGLEVQTFGTRLKKQLSQYTTYLSGYMMFMYAIQGLRSMFEQVKLIDSAMTELKKVTNETDEAYSNFLKNAATRSREIGTTIDGLVSSTADFARLGYGFEDAQGLAEVANIYAVVGDEIEGVEGATKSLISTMAAFKNEMNGMSNTEFAMTIIDKFNEIGKLIA